jgi:S-adenosylmethionine/arginine decarboxylase-like enzyme
MFLHKVSNLVRNFSSTVCRKTYEDSKSWGLLTSIDIKDCCPKTIRDAGEIKRYVDELCKHIDMNKYGECQVVHFGSDKKVAGFSMFQFIETSCISGHFANDTNRSYIDIFSCKYYDPKEASKFTADFFKGKSVDFNVILRK